MAFTDSEIAEARQAASQGSAQAHDLYRMGLIYSTGQGAPIDLVEAHKWFNLAATRGSDAAKACRKELADQMTSDEVALALRGAREWLNQIH